MSDLKIGLIGLDTSHVTGFAKCLNKPGDMEHVPGGKITCAYAGGSDDFHMSADRVDKFTAQVRDEFGIKILDQPEAVAESVDLLFITAVDGRTHLDYVRRTIAQRKPTFIDKPMATNSADAREMFKLADQHNVAMMSCSSLRYAQSIVEATGDESLGKIVGCDVFGPMEIEPTQGGLFWYGIHSVELVNRIMGRGCREVRATTTQTQEQVTAIFPDGRVAMIHGLRKAHLKFGVTIHREKGFQFVDAAPPGKRSWYASMLDAVMNSLPKGKSDVAQADTLEIIRMIEAANESRSASGKALAL